MKQLLSAAVDSGTASKNGAKSSKTAAQLASLEAPAAGRALRRRKHVRGVTERLEASLLQWLSELSTGRM